MSKTKKCKGEIKKTFAQILKIAIGSSPIKKYDEITIFKRPRQKTIGEILKEIE